MSAPNKEICFNLEYETVALKFLQQHDTGYYVRNPSLEFNIINDNFTVEEVETAIDYLKNGKSPGIDGIPAEFIKCCKCTLSPDITLILNYIIGLRDFPTLWTEGLKSVLFKSGSRLDTGNYRGITILPIIEKIFETVVYHRLSFANDAFNKKDKLNGGFQRGSRTADNIFILQGMIQRQLSIGSNLVVCFVDFSKAFDLINRHILFYKLMKGGWYGPVIDTLRNLYCKTSYRIKSGGRVSSRNLSTLGVNQGGVASGLLFRTYMADLESYLSVEHGICTTNEIIAHLLWADDLILFSDTFCGLQKQLDGLHQFCFNNHMIVNEMKTKFMVFGKPIDTSKLPFNSKFIEEVKEYKYLGNIISSIKQPQQDPFMRSYAFLCDQARKALFSMTCKTKTIGHLPPEIMFNLFDALIKPILTYGSDVWGFRSTLWGTVDKVFLQFSRCILHVKATTSNIITVGECGRLPPSTSCQISALRYINRLYHMPDNELAKKVFLELVQLNHQGFTTWATAVLKLASDLNLDITDIDNKFANDCKKAIRNRFISSWFTNLHNVQANPILRTYVRFKSDFVIEPYLYLVKKLRYREAISKFRCSSHTLAIESDRHTNPRTPVADRKCLICDVIEDELHFLLNCKINLIERNTFFDKIVQTYEEFTYLNDVEKFNFIMTNCNPQLLKWLGKFIHISFHKRNLNSASYRNWIYGVLHAYPGCGNQSRVLIYIPCWICHGCANRYALIMRILHLFIIQVH